MKYGVENESNAIKFIENQLKKKVTSTGIWFHTNGILGASPDGLVDEDKIVEVKCLPRYENCLDDSLRNPKERKKKHFVL